MLVLNTDREVQNKVLGAESEEGMCMASDEYYNDYGDEGEFTFPISLDKKIYKENFFVLPCSLEVQRQHDSECERRIMNYSMSTKEEFKRQFRMYTCITPVHMTDAHCAGKRALCNRRNDVDAEMQYDDTPSSLQEGRALVNERHVVRWGVIASLLDHYWLEHLKRNAVRAIWATLNEMKQHQAAQRTVGHQDVPATRPSFIF